MAGFCVYLALSSYRGGLAHTLFHTMRKAAFFLGSAPISGGLVKLSWLKINI